MDEKKGGRGICPIMSNGQSVAVPCKGEKCQLWDEERGKCAMKAMSWELSRRLNEMSESLHSIARSLDGKFGGGTV